MQVHPSVYIPRGSAYISSSDNGSHDGNQKTSLFPALPHSSSIDIVQSKGGHVGEMPGNAFASAHALAPALAPALASVRPSLPSTRKNEDNGLERPSSFAGTHLWDGVSDVCSMDNGEDDSDQQWLASFIAKHLDISQNANSSQDDCNSRNGYKDGLISDFVWANAEGEPVDQPYIPSSTYPLSDSQPAQPAQPVQSILSLTSSVTEETDCIRLPLPVSPSRQSTTAMTTAMTTTTASTTTCSSPSPSSSSVISSRPPNSIISTIVASSDRGDQIQRDAMRDRMITDSQTKEIASVIRSNPSFYRHARPLYPRSRFSYHPSVSSSSSSLPGRKENVLAAMQKKPISSTENHSLLSAPSLQSSASTFPSFSFSKPVYTPQRNLFCGEIPSPLYQQPLFRLPNTLAFPFGNNHFLSDAIITTQYHHIHQACADQHLTLCGVYYNQNGWYLLFPDQDDPPSSPSILDRLFRTLTVRVSYPIFRQVSLCTTTSSFLAFLTYVTEVSRGCLSAHRSNQDTITLMGTDPLLSQFIRHLEDENVFSDETLMSNSHILIETVSSTRIPSGKSCEQVLKDYEDVLEPTQDVTCHELQGLWTKTYAARLLDNTPCGFDCFLSRCYRTQLMKELEELMSIPSTMFQSVIHCTSGYYVVMGKVGAPTRERWKRCKSRIQPTLFGIAFVCQPIRVLCAISMEELRAQVEAVTSNVTIFCNSNHEVYLVGIQTAVASATESLVDVIAPQKMDS